MSWLGTHTLMSRSSLIFAYSRFFSMLCSTHPLFRLHTRHFETHRAKRAKFAWPKRGFWHLDKQKGPNLLVPKGDFGIWTSKKGQICLSQRGILAFGQAKRAKFAWPKGGFWHLDKQKGPNLLVPKGDLGIWTSKKGQICLYENRTLFPSTSSPSVLTVSATDRPALLTPSSLNSPSSGSTIKTMIT